MHNNSSTFQIQTWIPIFYHYANENLTLESVEFKYLWNILINDTRFTPNKQKYHRHSIDSKLA